MERAKIITDGGLYFPNAPSSAARFSTGCTLLDCALSGGWAEERVLNIVGDKSTGKTLLAEEAVANYAHAHPKAEIKYREVEKAFDLAYATNLGIPLDRIDFGDDDSVLTVEHFYDDLKKFAAKCLKKKVEGFYVLDSLDALTSERELTSEFGAASYGTTKAADMSKLFRMLNQEVVEAHVTLMIISQVRDAINVTFGRQVTRSGGRALDFYASQVIFLGKLGPIDKTKAGVKRTVGINIRAKIDKIKVGPPYRECEFPIAFGYGVDDIEANVRWLAQVGRLSEIGLDVREEEKTGEEDEGKKKNQAIVTKYLDTLRRAGDDEYYTTKGEIEIVVKKAWEFIESQFLPTRRKYGSKSTPEIRPSRP